MVDEETLHSELVGRDFFIQTFLPDTWDGRTPLRVVVALDGDTSFQPTARALVASEATDVLLVAVGYGEQENHRADDYLPPSRYATFGGGVEPFQAFLSYELLPWVDAGWPTTGDAADRVLIGHSFGGVAVLWALFHDAPFGGYIALSPSLYWDHGVLFDEEAAWAETEEDLAASVYLAAGGLETYGMVAYAEGFGEALESRGYPSLILEQEILAGQDHVGVYRPGVEAGLKAVLP